MELTIFLDEPARPHFAVSDNADAKQTATILGTPMSVAHGYNPFSNAWRLNYVAIYITIDELINYS
jgi:hypothetical protein